MLQVPQIHSTLAPCISISARDLKPVISSKKPSIFVKVWKAITVFVHNLFKQFSLKKEATPFDLSRRQIRMIRQAQVDRSLPREHSIKTIRRPAASTPEEEPIPTPRNPLHDASLEKMKAFLQAFSQIVVNQCAYEDVLTPMFSEWKDALLHLIASIPEWNETFLKLKESASPLISSLKNLDDAAVTLVIQQMLKHYVKNDRETVKAELLEKLQELWELEAIDDIKYQQAKSYLDPMLNWLYHPNNWMVRSSQPVNLHLFFSDSIRFFDTLTRYMQDGGMDDFFKEASRFVEEDFEDEIARALELNTGKIALLLSNRLADLIEHLPFEETFNQLLGHIVLHMDGWIASDKAKDEQSRLVEDAEKANKARPTNVDDIERQKTAQELLELIRNDGGKEQYLENEFIRAFSKHASCHKKVGEMAAKVDEEESEKIAGKVFSDLIDRIFPFLLPKKKYVLPYGLEVEVNGISRIIRDIELPEKLEALRKLGMAEFEKVLGQSTVKDKDNFRDYFFALTHIIIVEYIQSKMKARIAEELHNLFTRLANKEYLDYLAAEFIFPSLIDTMLDGFVRSIIERQSRKVATYLHEMLEADSDVRDNDHALVQFLYEAVEREVIDFDLNEAGIDREHFRVIVQPVITEMYEIVAAKKDKHPTESLSESEVRACLREYFKFETVPVNHDYGKLIMNALFKIGSFGGWLSEKVVGWFQGTLSMLTSQTLHPISKDHQMLVESIIESTTTNLLSIEAVRENLFSNPLSEDELERQRAVVNEKLPLQLRRISALTHDSIYRSLEARSEPWIQHFTPTTAKIDTVMHNVFNNLLGNSMLNTSLLITCAEKIKDALEQSAKEVDAHILLQDRLTIVESQ